MEITSYIVIFIFIIIWGIFLFSLLSIFSSFFIIPAYYGYINIRRKKIRGFISLALWGTLCIFVVWYYFYPTLSEEEYNTFMENYEERCEVVEKILNDEIYIDYNGKCELPAEYKNLSLDGVVIHQSDIYDDTVCFVKSIHYINGVKDYYTGYAYISDGAYIKRFYSSYYYVKIKDNWYYVEKYL